MKADFKMWYNLDSSFPDPATYFDMHNFLPDLISPPTIAFKDKTNVSIVWINSNCDAFNKRQEFVKKLMNLTQLHSMGRCLKNDNSASNHKGIGTFFSSF